MFLNKLQSQYELPNKLYVQIRKTLNYDNQMAVEGLEQFIETLPFSLRIAVAYNIHHKTFT